MGHSGQSAVHSLEAHAARKPARPRSGQAYYELGLACSMGSEGRPIDLVQAHKWFNLAAMAGFSAAQLDRAEIASSMSAAEIAAAQREARTFLAGHGARAA